MISNPNKSRYGHYEMKEINFRDSNDIEKSLNQTILTISHLDDYSFEKHQNLMSGHRNFETSKNPKKARANFIKRLVSANRTRYRDKFYDLDLTYITSRIIAMGYPSFGCESLYRNNFKDVLSFLKRYHQNHAKIYNLCQEENHRYDPKVFQNEGFEANNFKIQDHHPCRLKKIFDFCVDAFLFESKDPKNTIVIHCKAGKGRTGLITTCYLLFIGCCKTFEDAVLFFGKRRTVNGEGLTISSQIRYLNYFEKLLKKYHNDSFPKICLEFLKDAEKAYEKYIPHKSMNLKFINFGPTTSKLKKVKFEVHDLEGNLLMSYNTKHSEKENSSCKDLKPFLTLLEITENGKTAYSLVNNNIIMFEDDIKFIIWIDKIKLIAIFNLNFLRSPKDNHDFVSYTELGVPIQQKSRAATVNNMEKEPILYVEFKSYDFEKWYSNKKAQKYFPEDFSLIIAFEDTKQSIIQASK